MDSLGAGVGSVDSLGAGVGSVDSLGAGVGSDSLAALMVTVAALPPRGTSPSFREPDSR